MRTAAPKGGGADANRKLVGPGLSIPSGAAGQALTHVLPTWRRLDSVIGEIVANLRRQRVAEDFPADIQIAISALGAVVAEGRP